MPIVGTYTYPTAAELRAIAQDLLPRLEADRPIFDVLPITTRNEAKLIWEQLENFQGLQKYRGYNGSPQKLDQVGINQFEVTPGVYGEYVELDEYRLSVSRAEGRFGASVDVSELITEQLVRLLQRRLDRIESIGWNVLQGTYSVSTGGTPTSTGGVVITDSYNVQTYSAATTWGTLASATPFWDFSQVKLKHRGHSVNFGTGAKAYMNMKTANNLINNSNSSDLFGRRVEFGGAAITFNNLELVNQVLSANGAPTIVEYDKGYLSDGTDGHAAGTYVPYIPDNTVIVVGKRPGGQMVGEYRMVRNANNPNDAPGAYTHVIVPKDHLPVSIQVHDGHTGGPVIQYPSSVVVMSV